MDAETLRTGLGRGTFVLFGLALCGLACWGVFYLGIHEGDVRSAILVILAGVGLCVLLFSDSLFFVYVCVVAPLVITLNQHSGRWGTGKMTLYFLLVVAIMAAILARLRSRPPNVFAGPLVAVLALMLVYFAGHVLGADDWVEAGDTLVLHIYHWPFMFLPFLLLRERWQVQTLQLYLGGLGAALALGAVVVSTIAANLLALLAVPGTYTRIHMYFGNANSFGVFLSLSFFIVYLGLVPRTRLVAILKVAVCGTILLALLLTFSRRAWIATGVILLIDLLYRRNWRGMVVLVLVGGFLSQTVLEQVRERAESILEPDHYTNVKRQREVSERLDILFGSEVGFLGKGLDRAGSAQSDADVHRWQDLYFHNYFLTLFYIGGFPALLLYLGQSFLALWGLRQIIRRARAPGTRGAAAAGMAAVAVMLITGLFGTANVVFPSNFVSALAVGLGFAAYACERRRPPPESVPL